MRAVFEKKKQLLDYRSLWKRTIPNDIHDKSSSFASCTFCCNRFPGYDRTNRRPKYRCLTITASVKARLVADKLSNFTRIDVDTVNAVGSSIGMVESEFEKRRTEDIASLVDGVNQIVNNLQVQKAPAPKSE
jgi:hypothetical protein